MSKLFDRVSDSLGRDSPPAAVPPPPFIEQRFIRLKRDHDLLNRFREVAAAARMSCLPANRSAIVDQVLSTLKERQARSVLLSRCNLLDRVALLPALRAAGIDARYWDESTLDAAYDVDVGITDVYAAVAETGSIVVKSSAAHGRAISLVPAVHIAIVEQAQILPDLVDLFEKIAKDGTGSGVVIITGPSKTADIEMNLITGVHGPGEVIVFVLETPATGGARD